MVEIFLFYTYICGHIYIANQVNMTKEEFCRQCRELREKSGISLMQLCKQADLDYNNIRKIESGLARRSNTIGMVDIMLYLAAIPVKLSLVYQSEVFVINSYADIVHWFSASIKNKHFQTQIAGLMGWTRLTPQFIMSQKKCFGIDNFLNIAEAINYQVKLEPGEMKNERASGKEVHYLSDMTRQAFCEKCRELRIKSNMTPTDLWKKTGLHHIQIRRIENGENNFNMRDIILFLSSLRTKLSLVSSSEKTVIGSYDDVIQWIVSARAGKFTQRDLSEKIHCSCSVIENAERKATTLRIDFFLRIVEALGYQIEFKKT